MKSKAREMYRKYPLLFMEMYLHSLKEDPEHPDDNSVIYSKIQANVANPGTYWMPDWPNIDEILKDFASLREEE